MAADGDNHQDAIYSMICIVVWNCQYNIKEAPDDGAWRSVLQKGFQSSLPVWY